MRGGTLRVNNILVFIEHLKRIERIGTDIELQVDSNPKAVFIFSSDEDEAKLLFQDLVSRLNDENSFFKFFVGPNFAVRMDSIGTVRCYGCDVYIDSTDKSDLVKFDDEDAAQSAFEKFFRLLTGEGIPPPTS